MFMLIYYNFQVSMRLWRCSSTGDPARPDGIRGRRDDAARIAVFVLTMGMGVDSNVLIFERIKEELEAQRGVRAAINAGFSRVFLTLVDTHTAALISAAFLFNFGTGPIRGFAVTLAVGLLANIFTSTFVSKTLFELVLAGRKQVSGLSI